MLPLPGFLLLASDIYSHGMLFNQTGIHHHAYFMHSIALYCTLMEYEFFLQHNSVT